METGIKASLTSARSSAITIQQLTKSEKRIANYLRKNQEESAFLAAGEIADRLGLSEATLVRFARHPRFQQLPSHAYRITRDISADGSPTQLAYAVVWRIYGRGEISLNDW